MKQSLLMFALTIVLSGFAFAQDSQPQTENDPCANFKMRVVKPSETLDSKMVLPADAGDHPMVKNPCRPSSRLAEQTKPGSPESPQQQPSAAPSLKFRLPEGRVKTPSEVLKQFAVPKPNRN